MNTIPLAHLLLQIETIGPEGNKLIWVFLTVMVLLALIGFGVKRRKNFSLSNPFKREINVSLAKNKSFRPDTIHLKVVNGSKKSMVIEHPVIRFNKGQRSKAFKIKAVNSSKIYPLYLEAGQTHHLPIDLQPFYDFNPELKKYARIRIELIYNRNKTINTKYLQIKSTLFRKA